MPKGTLLDNQMPQWHFREYHQVTAPVDPAGAYAAILDVDLAESRIVGTLLKLRELPYRLLERDFHGPKPSLNLQDFFERGFIDLGRNPPHELLMGMAGRFWTLKPEIVTLTAGEFAGFQREDCAKVAVNLLVTDQGHGSCLLSTETRILCLGPKALSSFRRYWALIRLFSGLIRREWLRLIARQAETRRSLP